MDLIRRIGKRALPVVALLAAGSAAIDWRSLPVAVLLGGAIGFIHLIGVGRTVRAVAGGEANKRTAVFSGIFRLAVVGSLLYLLVAHANMNILALLAGMAAIHLSILTEGYKDAMRQL